MNNMVETKMSDVGQLLFNLLSDLEEQDRCDAISAGRIIERAYQNTLALMEELGYRKIGSSYKPGVFKLGFFCSSCGEHDMEEGCSLIDGACVDFSRYKKKEEAEEFIK